MRNSIEAAKLSATARLKGVKTELRERFPTFFTRRQKLSNDDYVFYALGGNPALGHDIGDYLGLKVEEPASLWPDGEVKLYYEDSIRDRRVIAQNSGFPDPNTRLMEVSALGDAVSGAGNSDITLVISPLPYEQSDRMLSAHVPIMARQTARRIIQGAGVTKTVLYEPHSGQLQGYFDIPASVLLGAKSLADSIKKLKFNPNHSCIVAPDASAAKRAKDYCDQLGIPESKVVIASSTREGKSEKKRLNSVSGRIEEDVLIIDDKSQTGGTIQRAAQFAKENGAKRIAAAVPHLYFLGDSIEKLTQDGIMEEIIFSDSIDTPRHREVVLKGEINGTKFTRVGIGSYVGKALYLQAKKMRQSSLFDTTTPI